MNNFRQKRKGSKRKHGWEIEELKMLSVKARKEGVSAEIMLKEGKNVKARKEC